MYNPHIGSGVPLIIQDGGTKRPSQKAMKQRQNMPQGQLANAELRHGKAKIKDKITTSKKNLKKQRPTIKIAVQGRGA